VIETQTNQVAGSQITVGARPFAIAIASDQPPLGSFFVPVGRPGVPVAFNASASGDPADSIASYFWNFGDGVQDHSGGVSPRHAYSFSGTYEATLTLTDDEGCSIEFVFTGQTAYCDGSPLASQTQTVTVAYPGVRVSARYEPSLVAAGSGCSQ